jgi:RimJ/RimL family protein N-acetyltransferase
MADTGFTLLRSPRLVLRPLSESDLDAICAYRSLPEVARYQEWEGFDRAAGQRLLAEQRGRVPDSAGTWFQMAIVVVDRETVAGDCGLHTRGDDPRQVEVGITLAPGCQRHGYATEALECLLDYVFLGRAKHRATAVVDAANAPAAALFERLGFRQEAHFVQNVWFKGRWGDELGFGLLRQEWLTRRAPDRAGGSA